MKLRKCLNYKKNRLVDVTPHSYRHPSMYPSYQTSTISQYNIFFGDKSMINAKESYFLFMFFVKLKKKLKI